MTIDGLPRCQRLRCQNPGVRWWAEPRSLTTIRYCSEHSPKAGSTWEGPFDPDELACWMTINS